MRNDFNNNIYWHNIPKSKRLLLPYPNILKNNSDKTVMDVLSKKMLNNHFIIINMDHIRIPAILDIKKCSRACILNITYAPRDGFSKIYLKTLVNHDWSNEFFLKNINTIVGKTVIDNIGTINDYQFHFESGSYMAGALSSRSTILKHINSIYASLFISEESKIIISSEDSW